MRKVLSQLGQLATGALGALGSAGTIDALARGDVVSTCTLGSLAALGLCIQYVSDNRDKKKLQEQSDRIEVILDQEAADQRTTARQLIDLFDLPTDGNASNETPLVLLAVGLQQRAQQCDLTADKISSVQETADEILRRVEHIQYSLDELPDQVASRVEQFTRNEPLRPAQLPSPSHNFVGREAELEELRAAADKEGVLIAGLQGQGGIGKTALALKLADERKHLYPDGQIYLDLLGTSANPLSTDRAMEHVVRSLLGGFKLPEDPQTLAGLYRSVLDGKQVLLLLDNAAGPEQVEPLMPPPSCGLLVTSRQHFVLDGLTPKDLGLLKPDDTAALVRKIAPQWGDLTEELCRLCGNLAYAVELAAKLLPEHPTYTPDQHLQRLQADRLKHLEPVAKALQASYDLLEEEDQRFWRTLGVFPESFDPLAAAAVCLGGEEPDVDLARDALDRLHSASLVQFDQARRFSLHDLARDFALSLLSEEEREEAGRRHAEHYLLVLRFANEFFLQGEENVVAGVAVHDLEEQNIAAGYAWARDRAERNDRAARLVLDYPDAGGYVLNLRQHARQRIDWLEAAVAAARRLGDRGAEGDALGNLGIAHAALGDARRAIEFYEQNSEITREIGDRRGEGTALGSLGTNLGNLGNAHFALGDARRAIEFHTKAIEISRELGDRRAEGKELTNLGIAHAALGNARRAIECYEQRLEITREIGDRRGDGIALGNLGNAHFVLGDARQAIEFYEQQLVITREIGDRHGEGNALGNLGNAHATLGDARRAIEFYEQNLEITREIGNRHGEGAALGNLGIAHAVLGDTRRAVDFYEQNLEIAREIGDRHGEGNALGNLGNAHAALGDARRAIECYEQRLEIAREIGDRRGEGNALFNFALESWQLGQREEAVSRMQEAILIFEAIESPHAEQARQILAKWRSELGQQPE